MPPFKQHMYKLKITECRLLGYIGKATVLKLKLGIMKASRFYLNQRNLVLDWMLKRLHAFEDLLHVPGTIQVMRF